ncbi:AarF/ABC1/UbiB kinase family protein [Terriglobus sp. TAA 43]|uniref:ABC1 kinase family protein n=1 Tax=Terriglobus sp. TAA 43 TaxID=278961 RepID=UPI0012EE661F|nr:AarF/UbiB family protein [Terriglobus sp. TAA 43]
MAEPITGILDARSRGRYRDVLAILVRYGLSEMFENLARGRFSPRVSPKTVRDALCELGPAFIKFGQLLSTRDEILSKPFRDELAKLQDETTPFPFAVAQAVIEEELKGTITTLFERIESAPIASGSIGQVHRAWLKDGMEVAVKVQGKGLEELLHCDTAIIQQLILRMKHGNDGDSAARLVSDFMNDVQSELDYELEANNLDRFAWQFEHDSSIRVPRVIRSHSARHVLTTTYEPGTKLADLKGYTPFNKAAAQAFARTLLRQIFCFGFFHGDPHADNVIVSKDGTIGFYDLGLVGELGPQERGCVNTLLYSLLQQDAESATASVLALADSTGSIDVAALREDMRRFLASHRTTHAVAVPRLLADILAITGKYRLILPRGFYLAFKVLATADSVGKNLDPAFDLIPIAMPLLRQNQPAVLPQDANAHQDYGIGLGTLLRFQDFSATLRTTFTQLAQGQLKIQLDHLGLEDASRCYDRANARLALVLFVGLLVLGGCGIICSLVLAKLLTARQAIIAVTALAVVSSVIVALIHRGFRYKNASARQER